MPSGTPALQRYANILKTARQDLEDLNVAQDGLRARLGIKTEKAKGGKLEGTWADGYLWNVEARGLDEVMPSTTRNLSSSTSDDQDMRERTWTLEPKYIYAGMKEYGPTMALAKLGGGGEGLSFADFMENTLKVRAMEMDRMLVGDSTGKLAVVQASGNSGDATIRIKRHDTSNLRYAGERGGRDFLRKGRTVVFINPATGQRIGSKAYKVRSLVQQPDYGYDSVTFTSTVDATIPAGAIIVPGDYDANTYGKEPNGLANIYDTGQNFESLMGISRADFEKAGLLPELDFAPTTAEGVAGHLVKLLHGSFSRVLDIFQASTNATAVTCLARKTLLRELTWKDEIREAVAGNDSPSELMARANQGGGRGPGQFQGGAKGFEFYHDGVNVKFVASPLAKPGEILGFVPGNLTAFTFGNGWELLGGYQMGNGGMGVRPVYNKDTVATYWRSMENLHCRAPFEAFRMSQLLTQEDVIPQT